MATQGQGVINVNVSLRWSVATQDQGVINVNVSLRWSVATQGKGKVISVNTLLLCGD